jgi:hypothetical protein
MNTSLLTELIEEYKGLDAKDKKYAPVKTRDANDHYIGTLPSELCKLWIIREIYCQKTDELIQKTIDLLTCFKDDVEENDSDLPGWIMTSYNSKFQDLFLELRPSYRKFKAADRMLFSLIELQFERPAEMPFFAIRSGYKVHCRKDNTRNDKYSPLSQLTSVLMPKNIVHIEPHVIKAQLPEGVDISKLSPKEILKIILNSME